MVTDLFDNFFDGSADIAFRLLSFIEVTASFKGGNHNENRYCCFDSRSWAGRMQVFFDRERFPARLNGRPNLANNCIHFKRGSRDHSMNLFPSVGQKTALEIKKFD